MLSILAINRYLPQGVGEIAGQVADPSYVGNLLIIAIFLVVIGIYGFMLDRHNILINLLALYIGILVVKFLPDNLWGINWLNNWWGTLAILFGTMILTTLFLSWTHLFKVVYTHNFFIRWWQAIISGILYVGLLTATILTILSVDILKYFSNSFLKFFTSGPAYFLWLIVPLIGLLVIRHKKRGPGRPSY